MLALLLLAAAIKSSSSVPVSPATDALDLSIPITVFGRELPEYINPSQHRTLHSIIWSCLVTIFSCTWAAVHPNVPKPSTSGWERFKDKITITVCGMLVPELITAWALKQRIGATRHMKEYNKKFHSGGELPA